MADTIPVQTLNDVAYQNINTLSGINAGISLSIQNQSKYALVKLVVQTDQPDVDADNFVLVSARSEFPALVSSGNNSIWGLAVRTRSIDIGVQEIA